ncbi:uncharacterized protein LOC123272094 [Cotesia glomerata]|uniref:uncharacterized protein LOC123272094 n=1 Tax=Cotesia glomerata TaxID=32391 RepID=UPI001D01DF61|nr:uncharacterized protein LOC123272094 [Cotesia glomerata]
MNRLLFLSIISIVIITGETLICYECELCDDVKTAKNVIKTNCTEQIPLARSVTCAKLDYVLSNGTTGTQSRGCLRSFETYSISLRASNSHAFVISQSIYYCNDTDLCNNSESLYSTSTIIFITIVTFICAIKNIY